MSPAGLAKLLQVPELPAQLARVDAALAKLAANAEPTLLREPLQRLVQPRGKRLRPALLLAVIACAGRPVDERTIAACTAVELVHLASLAHDDLIDNAATRWNRPTIHVQEGAAAALLVGDFLLAAACHQAATLSIEAAELVSATIATMCEGQALELADVGNINRTQESAEAAMRAKAAALFAAACNLGGLVASLPLQHIEALWRYGEAFGMIHQLLDDLLDLVSIDKHLGKPVGMDVRSGIYTWPVLLGLASPQRVKLQRALAQKDVATAVALLRKTDAFQQTHERLDTYNQQAAAALAPLDTNTAALRSFPGAYIAWALRLM